MSEVEAIIRKWFAVLGEGFHLDTRGEDYVPALSLAEVDEYNDDMAMLFAMHLDPYGIAVIIADELYPSIFDKIEQTNDFNL